MQYKKLYYRIGEVCEMVGVQPHVLRYWESEFPRLSPPKNRAGQRTYRPKDIEMLLQIRRLLYDDGFTIAGARKKLAESSGSASPGESGLSKPGPQIPADRPSQPARQRLNQVRRELENILTLLERG